jgi:hypothetical protein
MNGADLGRLSFKSKKLIHNEYTTGNTATDIRTNIMGEINHIALH